MSYSCTPRISAEFIGVPTTTLQAWLLDAQNTLQQLELGKNVNSAAYTQGDGSKSITNQPATANELRLRIQRLAMALGLVDRRSAMSPGF